MRGTSGRTWSALVLVVLASGCGTIGQQETVVTVSECAWTQPLILQPGDADAVSDQLAVQILQHNELWERHCGAQGDK